MQNNDVIPQNHLYNARAANLDQSSYIGNITAYQKLFPNINNPNESKKKAMITSGSGKRNSEKKNRQIGITLNFDGVNINGEKPSILRA